MLAELRAYIRSLSCRIRHIFEIRKWVTGECSTCKKLLEQVERLKTRESARGIYKNLISVKKRQRRLDEEYKELNTNS